MLISSPKWDHLPLNFARLLRYDATKLAPTCAFLAKCMGKSPKSSHQFSTPTGLEPLGGQIVVKMGIDMPFHYTEGTIFGIFDILSF